MGEDGLSRRGKTNRHLPPCYCPISTLKKASPPSSWEVRFITWVLRNSGLSSKQRVAGPVHFSVHKTPTMCQQGQGTNSAMQDFHLTLNQRGAGLRKDRREVPAQCWVSSAHSRAVLRGLGFTPARELAWGKLSACDTGFANWHMCVQEHFSDPPQVPVFL